MQQPICLQTGTAEACVFRGSSSSSGSSGGGSSSSGGGSSGSGSGGMSGSGGSSNNSSSSSNSSRQRVQWMNQIEETRASYDIVLTHPLSIGRERTKYIEVKTSRYPDKNVFEISLCEWEFATKQNPSVPYHLYRVYNAQDPANVHIVIIRDVLQAIQSRKARLCLAI